MNIRSREECRFDLVALGEVMLRFDPGDGRIATTRSFAVSEGGGEYNVARGLRRCFGLRSAIVTAFADNPVGWLLEDLILQGGVDQSYVRWLPYDGIGRGVRNGLNFVERGFGVRAALGCSDRGHAAASELAPGDVDWDRIFGDDGARWFHCGGIFAALSESAAAVALEAMTAARRHGVIVSFDLNYRPSLWQSRGGRPAASATNRILVGAGRRPPRKRGGLLGGARLPARRNLGVAHRSRRRFLREPARRGARRLPEPRGRGDIPARGAHVRPSTTGAGCAAPGKSSSSARSMRGLEIFDRVGGGDSFASGLIYGMLEGADLETALAYGVAHGALAMTTPGDTSMATLAEVRHVMRGGAPRVVR